MKEFINIQLIEHLRNEIAQIELKMEAMNDNFNQSATCKQEYESLRQKRDVLKEQLKTYFSST